MVSSVINAIVGSGLAIEECREAQAPPETLAIDPIRFGGTVRRPDFFFFRCGKK